MPRSRPGPRPKGVISGLRQGKAFVPHHGVVDDDAAFYRLARTVYVAARAGTVDWDAFDLATSKLEVSPLDPGATELALLCIECAEASQPRMAEVALSVLAAAGFDPGFAEEPGWLARLEDAMGLVNLDLAATGLRGRCRLRVHEDEPDRSGNAYAEAWDGYTGTSGGVYPAEGADPVSALVAVADDAQDAVMHALCAVWPVCPVHRLGVHARDQGEAAVWWCAGDGGHAAATIGEWRGR
jgi:hypothetical protein